MKVFKHLGMWPVLLALFAVLVFAMYLKNPLIAQNFVSLPNILTILEQASVKLVLAVGMTLIILSAGIDLSVGAVLAFAAVVGMGATMPAGTELNGDVLLSSYIPEQLALPAFLLAGLLLGMFNGTLVAYLKLNPFVATLATMIVWRGAAYIQANGTSILNTKIGFAWLGNSGLIDAFTGSDPVFDLPWLVIVAAVVIAVTWVILNRTILGKHIYAVGDNRHAAELTGVNVPRVLMFVYSVGGLCAGLAAAMTSARIFGANGKLGETYELDAIAAVVLGGTSLTGGVGTIIGTVVGVLFIEIMNIGLTALNVSAYWQMVAKGSIIIAAVLLDRFRQRKGRG